MKGKCPTKNEEKNEGGESPVHFVNLLIHFLNKFTNMELQTLCETNVIQSNFDWVKYISLLLSAISLFIAISV